jgi:hypothetical protein
MHQKPAPSIFEQMEKISDIKGEYGTDREQASRDAVQSINRKPNIQLFLILHCITEVPIRCDEYRLDWFRHLREIARN